MTAPPHDRTTRERREDPHDQYVQLVVGYALDALEPDEEQLLLRHLPACARCERDLVRHRESLAELAHAADPVEPPVGLWDGIRAGVLARDPDAFAAPGVGGSAAPVGTAPAVHDELAAARERRQTRRARALMAVAAAAVVATVGVGSWNVLLQRDRGEQGQLAASAAAAVDALEASPGRTVPLVGSDGQPVAVAVLTDQGLSLVLEGLPRNDTADSTYVVWGQTGGAAPTPLGAFDVADERLDVVRDLALPAGTASPEVLLITQERGRTAPASTTQPVLASGRA